MADGRRFENRAVIVVGGGQTPGATVGNGRAAALLYAREGACVLVADRDEVSARETAAMIDSEGGRATAVRVDVTRESEIADMVTRCIVEFGAVDVLHNNVGVSHAGGDAPVTEIEPEAFSRVMDINLRSMVLASKHVLPVMRERRRGVIINIGSISAITDYPTVAYKTSKAGVIALTEHLAIRNAAFGVRANAVLPGLMDTPMAVERHVQGGRRRDDIVTERADRIPFKGRPGDAWDVARAAAFLASDDAGFVTGASLVVDGGQTLTAG